MFSFIKRLFRPEYKESDAGPTIVNTYKMSLDERKAWRLEMLHKSIFESFSSIEILRGMYRYRAIPIDDRGHYYAIMIETTKSFLISKNNTAHKLQDVEEMIKTRTFDNYGVVIDGIYWRANDTIGVLERRTNKRAKIDRAEGISSPEEAFSDTIPVIYQDAATQHVSKFEPLVEEEALAFKEALAAGQKPPVIKIGGKDYDTDLAPLGLR